MSLCMGCMTDKGSAQICPKCGLDEAELSNMSPVFLRPGTELNGRYTVGLALGQGGFGITYIGYDNVLNTRVAIKEYYPADIAGRTSADGTVSAYTQGIDEYTRGKQRFIEEARTLAKFADHPCIVGVKDCFDANETAYMVMEFLEGVNLKEYLKRKGGKLSVNEAISILTPVMDALRAVHNVGIIHRDISPDNIYITTDARVRLIDFGAARQSIGGQKSLSIMLKPGYAPEEQYRTKGNQGPWTDVYALTATFYRMITGTVPPDSLERVMEDTLEIPNELPTHIREALRKGLAVRASERFSNIEQLRMALGGRNVQAAPNTAEGNRMPGGNSGAARGNVGVGFGGVGQEPGNYRKQRNNGDIGNGGSNKVLIAAIAALSAVVVISLICVVALVLKSAPEPVVSTGGTVTSGVNQQYSAPEPAPPPEPIVHSYDVVVSSVLWDNAWNDAVAKGGYLVAINDAEEFGKIKNILSNYGNVRNVWIGARAPQGYNSPEAARAYWNSSAATWENGEPFNFASWRAGEPSGYDANIGVSERYLQIFSPKSDGYVWSFNDAGTDISEYKAGTLAYIIEYENGTGMYR